MRARWLIPAVSLLLAAVLVACVLFVWKTGRTVPVAETPLPQKQVVVDPGHGGEDGGAEVGRTIEKEINLAISLNLAELLRQGGFEVILTRTEDISIYDESEKSLRNKKRSDILNRLQIANGNPEAVMVSVHQNKFGQSQYSGAQMFYGLQNKWSKPLAECLQQSFVRLLQPDNARQVKPITKSVYLIHNAKPPAVLCECGFLSNPAEGAKLADPAYQQQVAFAIYSGILDFYSGLETAATPAVPQQ